MKRKALSILCAAGMAVSALAVPTFAEAPANEDITIGVSIWSSTDVPSAKRSSTRPLQRSASMFSMWTRVMFQRRLPLLLTSCAQPAARAS